jgi:hypothetical protein
MCRKIVETGIETGKEVARWTHITDTTAAFARDSQFLYENLYTSSSLPDEHAISEFLICRGNISNIDLFPHLDDV